MTTNLQCEDFAGESLAIPYEKVTAIRVTEARVWVSITDDLWYRQIEVKNALAVSAWGRENDKLIEE